MCINCYNTATLRKGNCFKFKVLIKNWGPDISLKALSFSSRNENMHYLPGWGAARFIKHLSTLGSFDKKTVASCGCTSSLLHLEHSSTQNWGDLTPVTCCSHVSRLFTIHKFIQQTASICLAIWMMEWGRGKKQRTNTSPYLRFIKLLFPVCHLIADNSSDIFNDHSVLFNVSSSIQAQALQKTHSDLEFHNEFTFTLHSSPCPKTIPAENHVKEI